MNETHFTPVDPEPAQKEEVGFPTIVGRFVVRMWLDDAGAPSAGRFILTLWTPFAAAFYWRALTASGEVAMESVFGVTAVTITLCLWAMALKLGAGVFVPIAEGVAGVFTRSVRGAVDLWQQTHSYGGGPDRTVGLTDPGGELHRPSEPGRDPRQPDPFRDDETGDGP